MRFPSWIWSLLIALVILAETGAAAFRFVADRWNAGGSQAPVLRFRVPEELRSQYRAVAVEPRQVKDLSFDRVSRYAIPLRAGKAVEIVSLEYDGGNKNHWMDAYTHPPENCMRLAGGEIAEVYPERVVPAAGEEHLTVRATRVRTGDASDFYVFRGSWIPHAADPYPWEAKDTFRREYLSKRVRLKQAFSLHPSPPGLIHVVGVHGASTYEEACRIFEEIAVRPLRLVKS